MATRAKFRCNTVTEHAGMSGKTYVFGPVYDTSIPEDQRFAQYSPSGELRILVDNPAVDFPLGAYFYLDFTKVEEPAPAE